LSVMVWVSYKIVRQELLLNTESMYEGRLKMLVVYFARIVLSDLLLWIPAAALYFLSWSSSKVGPTEILAYHCSLLFTGIQLVALFACSMAKKDARKLITDLVCGWVYCFRSRGSICNDDSGEPSRRWSSSSNSNNNNNNSNNNSNSNNNRLSSSDPYLAWFSTSPARGASEEGEPPTPEAFAVEESQIFRPQDQETTDCFLDDPGNNKNARSATIDLDPEDIEAEA